MRPALFLLAFILTASLSAQESSFRLFGWERGIGLYPVSEPEMRVYLWFYEWNMFGAVDPSQHTRGTWENATVVSGDGRAATIDCPPHFKLAAKVSDEGAELTLHATNNSERDWPELAGIIACFNPGPEEGRNPQFDNENTLFRAPEGLLKLNKREIHWNDDLRPSVDSVQPDLNYVWKEKWPTAEPNATGGFIMRESRDAKWRTGIAWERFLSCQGHNPWKCMHLGIHLGPLPAGAERTVRGRIYLTGESAEQLLDRYEGDFPRPDEIANARKSPDETSWGSWMENMAAHHRFTLREIRAATGMNETAIRTVLREADFEIPVAMPKEGDPLRVLPYPGGRHPRIGFLEGAVRPQRETKLSVFAPWEHGGYVVADVPEAIWHHREDGKRELLYLAHTHVPTLWSRQGIELEPLEWEMAEEGGFVMRRKLPNGIEIGTRAKSAGQAVLMEQWITNGSDRPLTGLRVQNCVMLKGAPEFAAQSNDNKVLSEPYAACRDEEGKRWVITAWERCVRSWGNARCPCLHSDPQFADCPPGETVRIRGILSFYEGEDVESEFARLEARGWRD